jgi:hypothetical protein
VLASGGQGSGGVTVRESVRISISIPLTDRIAEVDHALVDATLEGTEIVRTTGSPVELGRRYTGLVSRQLSSALENEIEEWQGQLPSDHPQYRPRKSGP